MVLLEEPTRLPSTVQARFYPKNIFIWSEGLVRFGLKHLKVSSISDIESGSKLLRIFKYSRFPTDRCRVRRLRWYAEKFCTFEN